MSDASLKDSSAQRPIGLDDAARLLGTPVEREFLGPLPVERPDGRRIFGKHRSAEIIMVLPRPGGLLFHTKAFYPGGVLRLPSGGIQPGEAVLAAASREVEEETGLRLMPCRFLFHLIQHLDLESGPCEFHSLGFLYPPSAEPVQPLDVSEEITELCAVSWSAIPEVIRRLETLEPEWRIWGRFRAAPHVLLLELRETRPEWFDSGD